MEPSQPPIRLFFTEIKQPKRDVDHLPLSRAMTKNDWSCTYTPSTNGHGMERDNCTFYRNRSWRKVHRWLSATLPYEQAEDRHVMGKRNALNTVGELKLLPSCLLGVKNWEDNITMNLREVGWGGHGQD